MDGGYIAIAALIGIGILAGRRSRARPAADTRRSMTSVWLTLGALVAGLVIAGVVGSETWTWVFGLALMVACPVALFYGIGHGLGSAGKSRDQA